MLEEYSNKRNFTRTPEPLPQTQNIKGTPIFVVHKHAARRLHYDLRLEVDGSLEVLGCSRRTVSESRG